MSRPDNASVSHVDTCALLEHLPLPCLYVTLNRQIAFANAAARRLINPLVQLGGNAPSLHDGASILHNELLVALGLPAASELELFLQQLKGQQQWMIQESLSTDLYGPLSFTLPVSSRKSPGPQLAWTLTCCQIGLMFYFNLTAVPTTSGLDTPESKEQPSSEEEDWRMLQAIAGPTFDSPDLMCSIMTASQASYKLNERGRQFLSRAEWNAESYPWTPRQASTKFQTSLTDPEFTRRLPPEQGAAITTLSKRQALLNCRRGLANPETGERTVCNASTILLKKPHSDELLGVVVCVEPEDFSLYLQRYDNMRNTAPAAATASDWNKARLIRAITLEGDVDYVSTAWLTYTGLERADLHGQFWLDCVHPEDRNLFHQKLPTNYALAQSREREVRFRGRDGLYRWFSDRTEPLLNEEGKFVRWYSMSEDVHDLVIKRQQANTDKFLLEKILAELDVVSFTVDQTYTVSSASGTMKFDNIMSDNTYSSESMIGKNLHNFINSISPGGIPELQRCLINVMNGDSPKEIVEYAFGPRYIRTILIPHINEDHEPHSKYRIQGVVGTSIDITAAREHDEVKAQMKVMEDTNRLKSEFLANVSHELRTPIAGLTGLVELLFETELAFEQIDLLESVQSSAHTLLQIVNDILDFSKADASAIVLENMPFSILRFVDDVCKRNRVLAAKKGLQFRYTPLDSDIQLLGDTGRIRQILDNLLTNAIKFTLHGFVRLSASYKMSDNTVFVQFLIEDSGIGIERQDLDKLFLPFVQADQSTTRIYGGSGLGLSIARKMAETMGGSVTLESSKGIGTMAKVTLQLSQAPISSESIGKRQSQVLHSATDQGDVTRLRSARPKLSSQQKSNLHILFVEDNEINRKIVMAHLSSLGFKRVHAARNGAEAIGYVNTAPSSNGFPGTGQHTNTVDQQTSSPLEMEPVNSSWPDIIIMDCQMPIMDGYEATQRLRSLLHYDRPIIALTASAIDGDREKCIIAGMDDHIAKPVSRKQLAEIIDKWALIATSSLTSPRQSLRDVSVPT